MSKNKNQRKYLQVPKCYVNLTLEKMRYQRRCRQLKILGERLRQLREENGFSQNKLANEIRRSL